MNTFIQIGHGVGPKAAFLSLKAAAKEKRRLAAAAEYRMTHVDYSGTIAEKLDFLEVSCPELEQHRSGSEDISAPAHDNMYEVDRACIHRFVERMFAEKDPRFCQVGGQCGCVCLIAPYEDIYGQWVFFGVVS